MLSIEINKFKLFILTTLIIITVFSCSRIKIKRCPIKNCKTKMIHLHGGQEYRGRHWIYANQNPKIGQLHQDIVKDPGASGKKKR
jgi:hypothetical protein